MRGSRKCKDDLHLLDDDTVTPVFAGHDDVGVQTGRSLTDHYYTSETMETYLLSMFWRGFFSYFGVKTILAKPFWFLLLQLCELTSSPGVCTKRCHQPVEGLIFHFAMLAAIVKVEYS